MDLTQFRELFPEITDEMVAQRQAGAMESKKQSIRDQRDNAKAEFERLSAELESLETPSEEVNETPAQENAEPQG